MTIHCSIIGCIRSTLNPNSSNPRFRWIVGQVAKDDEGNEYTINLCPKHAKECLNLDEDFYERTERTEKFVREHALMN